MKHQILAACEAVRAGLANILFLSSCESCARKTDPSGFLCWRCIERLERVGRDAQEALLEALPVPVRGISFISGWLYKKQGPLQPAVQAMKYHNKPWIGDRLGFALGAIVSQSGIGIPDLVVPVPLHRLRQLQRGYNQSVWIARGVSRYLSLPCAEALARKRATVTQTHLSKEQRWKNVRAAFTTRAEHVGDNRSILLVDDVVTTGATAVSAALELQSSGVQKVVVVSVGLAKS